MTAAFRAASVAPNPGLSASVYQPITIPAATHVGDLMVLVIYSSATIESQRNVTQAGWTHVGGAVMPGTYGTVSFSVFIRTAQTGDPGSTFNAYGMADHIMSSSRILAEIAVYSDAKYVSGGVTPTTPTVNGVGVTTSVPAKPGDLVVLGGFGTGTSTWSNDGINYNLNDKHIQFTSGGATNRVWDPDTSYQYHGVLADSPGGGPWTLKAQMQGGSLQATTVFGWSMTLTNNAPPPPPVAPVEQEPVPPTQWEVKVPRRKRGWRYFATRLNGDGTESMLDMDLPLEDVSIDDVLSGDQQMNAKIDPAYSRLRGPDGHPILLEWGAGLYAEYDGDIRFGGILASSGFNGPEWSLETVGFTGYGRDMPWTGWDGLGANIGAGWTVGADGGVKGVKVDAIDPVRVAWAQLQRQPGGNIGLVIDDTTTGGAVLIGSALAADEYDPQGGGIDGVSLESQAYKFNRYTSHDLAGAIDDLAGMAPFDYHERHFWKSDGTIGHHLDIGYPALGQKRDDLRFVLGVNVFEPPQVDHDGEIYASGTLVLGAGDGSAAKWALAEPANRPAGRLRRIAVVVDDTLRSNKRCLTRAQAENAWRSSIDDISQVMVIDHPNARLGAAKVGDTIRLQARSDWDTWDLEVRILGITYNPADGGSAQYTIARTDKLISG